MRLFILVVCQWGMLYPSRAFEDYGYLNICRYVKRTWHRLQGKMCRKHPNPTYVGSTKDTSSHTYLSARVSWRGRTLGGCDDDLTSRVRRAYSGPSWPRTNRIRYSVISMIYTLHTTGCNSAVILSRLWVKGFGIQVAMPGLADMLTDQKSGIWYVVQRA